MTNFFETDALYRVTAFSKSSMIMMKNGKSHVLKKFFAMSLLQINDFGFIKFTFTGTVSL